ncbi:HTH domain-containing protein [Faecalicoccus pleomorphus]|uniref:HTH domain-containing protein n=1 Tax=Faecalicoccus pleomorphus TaxID=1323 RepID=UPI00189822E8|nr:HTH domain-containing protein [Faecalicoccus pleomorphus]MDB7985580.1 HTH domain-containing protein [Faecalicoccus pleomorphus]
MEYVTEKIIRYVLSQNEFKTAKQIAANINVSESSVKHNIAEAKMILSKVGGKLLSVPGKGFILESSSSDIEILKDEVFKLINQSDSYVYRQNYILNILFMKKSNYTIQIFADDLGVSRNTILYDLESIEKWLDFYNIKLMRVRNFGLTVEGDEFDIREAIMDSNKQLMEFTSIDIDRPDNFDLRISKTFLIILVNFIQIQICIIYKIY